MISPLRYASRYWNLQVPLDNGGFARVRIGSYLSGDPTAGKDPLWVKVKHACSGGKTLKATAHNGFVLQELNCTKPDDIRMHIVRPFYGKGSPEDCQIVLQLAMRFGLANQGSLQTYADNNLGLDCNGFVGNWLWYGLRGNPWYRLPDKASKGPSSLIDYLVRNPFVKTLDELKTGGTFTMALVDKEGRVIPGGGHGTGHIVVTNPGAMLHVPGIGGECIDKIDDSGLKPALQVVESTGGIGLTESWYSILSVKNGIFTVYRGCKRSRMPVRICKVA
jgi:hypothetical protein